jgi:hypothetical protein
VKKKFKRKFEEGYHGSVRCLAQQQQGIHSTHHGILHRMQFGTFFLPIEKARDHY